MLSGRQAMNKSLILLKTLLLSTSQGNIYRHCRDKRKRGKIIGGFIGAALIYAMIMAYCILMCIGYGTAGMIGSAPMMCALIISLLAFFFTLFKTNGYLFNFREYDMLMSFFVLFFPMLIASFIGFVIAKISAGFRKTNIIQTVLTMIFVIFCFSLRFIIEDVFKNDKVEATLEKTSEMTSDAADIYLPAKWFADAVTMRSVTAMLLLIGVSALLFAVIFRLVGNSYRSINSALKSHAAAKKYKMTRLKKHNVVNSIAFKEYKRLMGSTAYTVNGAMGEILAILLGLVTLIIGFDRIVSVVTSDAPFDHAILQPAIPFIIYFFIGMAATTAMSPSLEGKNYWILQSLPVERKTVYQGKMLFNMYLTVPAMAFSTLCICKSAGVPAADMLLYLILGLALCAFSTAWGCVCGVKHMRLDWENEIEVIKQGAAVAIYILPNMFVVMGLTVLVVILGLKMDHRLLTMMLIFIAALLAGLSYLRVMALAKRK